MDFLDPKKRRAYRIRLFVGYALMAIALGLTTLFLALATNGYGFKRSTGEIIQNGLVFVDSHPDRARIYINGQDKGDTAGRFVLEEGKYTFELKRDGYRTWKRDIDLEGSSVERLVYPFLFPAKITSADVQTYSAVPDMASLSPDRRWLVVHRAGALGAFEVTDANSKDGATTTITLPEAVMPARAGAKIEMAEWSTDNRHLLVKYIYESGSDYIIVDRESPAESVNLRQIFGKGFDKISLRDKNASQLYVWTADGGVLQAADVKDKALSPVASQVVSYFPYGDDAVLYTTVDGANTGKVAVKLRQGTAVYLVRLLPEGKAYLLSMADFNGKSYVAVGSSGDSHVYVYENVVDSFKKNVTALPLPKVLLKVSGEAGFLGFSANARFIAVQAGSNFAVYDAENNRQYKYDLKLPITQGQKAAWMDGHRLTLAGDDKVLRVYDFDGTNVQSLQPVELGFMPFFNRDYNAMYSISPSASVNGKPALVRINLKLNQ